MASNKEVKQMTESAIEILTDAAIERIRCIVIDTIKISERNGRAKPNGYDVFHALNRSDENVLKLANYIVNDAPTLDTYAGEFPVVLPSNYHRRDTNDEEPFPYRSNGYVEYDTERQVGIPHIPPYFLLPSENHQEDAEYWPEEAIQRNPSINDEILKQIKKEQPQPTSIDLKLFCPLSNEMYSSISHPDSFNE